MSDLLYHITTEEAWQDAQAAGEYLPVEYLSDGFIHASFFPQLKQTADFIFGGREKMLVLEIDQSLLDCKVVRENTTGGKELFPHIYGPLPVHAVMRTFFIENSEQGFLIPELEK